MTYWDKNPDFFKLILAVTSIFFVIHASYVFYLLITSTTDDNLYSQLDNYHYLTKPVFGDFEEKSKISRLDTVSPGHVLLTINSQPCKAQNSVQDILSDIPDDSIVKLEFYNLKNHLKPSVQLLKSKIPERFTIFIPMSAWVNAVVPGGASDRAGLEVGDLIIRVNGKTFSDVYEADRLMRRQGSGNKIVYEVIRGQNKFEVSITLANIGISWLSLFSLIASIITISIGFFIGYKRPNIIAGRMLAITIIFIGAILFNLFVRAPYDALLLSEVGLFLTNIIMFFGIPLFFHTSLYFPTEKPGIIRKQEPILIGYLLSAILFSSVAVLYFLQNRDIIYLVAMYGMVAIIIYHVVFLLFNSKHLKKIDKRKSLLLKMVIGIVVVFMTFDLIVKNFRLLPRDYIASVINFLPLLIFMVPVSIVFTIWRYRLLDIDFKLKRNITFTIILWLVNGFFFVLFTISIIYIAGVDIRIPEVILTGTAIEILGGEETGEGSRRLQYFILLALSVSVFYLLYLFRHNTSIWLNKKFHRQIINYKSVYQQVFESIEPSAGIAKIAGTFIDNIDKVFGFKRFGIVIYGQDNLIKYQNLTGRDNQEFLDFNKSLSRRFTQYLKEFGGVFSSDYLPDGIKEMYQKFGIQNLVPIRTRDQFNGIVLLGEKLSENHLTHDEVDLLKSISTQLSVTINNSLLYEKLSQQERIRNELEFARHIQTASLPSKVPDIEGFDIYGESIPAYEVGGDFFDYLKNSDDKTITFIVGDVSGKGTSAALYMSQVQGIIRTLNAFELSLKDLLAYTNDQLYKKIDKSFFVTVLMAKLCIEKMCLNVVRAGHNGLLHYSSTDNQVHSILPKGMGIGLASTAVFSKSIEDTQILVNKGDIIVLYTDGITDLRDSNNEDFGEVRLQEIIAKNHQLSSKNLKDKVFEELNNFAEQSSQFDDMTLVIVKIL